ncbi:hypothetical protein XELAEV_18004885mg, partial [Xenopus laevis]
GQGLPQPNNQTAPTIRWDSQHEQGAYRSQSKIVRSIDKTVHRTIERFDFERIWPNLIKKLRLQISNNTRHCPIITPSNTSTVLYIITPSNTQHCPVYNNPNNTSTVLYIITPSNTSTVLYITPSNTSTVLYIITPSNTSTDLYIITHSNTSTVLYIITPTLSSTVLYIITPSNTSTVLYIITPSNTSTVLYIITPENLIENELVTATKRLKISCDLLIPGTFCSNTYLLGSKSAEPRAGEASVPCKCKFPKHPSQPIRTLTHNTGEESSQRSSHMNEPTEGFSMDVS